MEITRTVRVEIKEEEVKKIVAEYISKKMDKKINPDDVSFQIGHKCEDYDDRFSVEYVKGCIVTYLDK